jgi:hypothetical protein
VFIMRGEVWPSFRTLMNSKLVNTLIGKSILETLLVGGIAVGFYMTTFPPTFHGWGEVDYQSRSIVGWAVNSADEWERVEIQLFVDGKLVGTQTANQSRLDVVAAGWSVDPWHGYHFQLNSFPQGRHTARVYAVRQSGEGSRYTLQLLGDPINFQVHDGSWQPSSLPISEQ